MSKSSAFEVNSQKAGAKVAVNAAMLGVLFFVLTMILALGSRKFHPLAIWQLVLATPLLFVSSLAYGKIAYWKETELWDAFAWITGNTGNILTLNAIGLMVLSVGKTISLAYFILTLLCMLSYSLINIHYNHRLAGQKFRKFGFFLALILIGGILPIYL